MIINFIEEIYFYCEVELPYCIKENLYIIVLNPNCYFNTHILLYVRIFTDFWYLTIFTKSAHRCQEN